MKKAILMIATILVAASAFAQTKEDINASVERAKNCPNFAQNSPRHQVPVRLMRMPMQYLRQLRQLLPIASNWRTSTTESLVKRKMV